MTNESTTAVDLAIGRIAGAVGKALDMSGRGLVRCLLEHIRWPEQRVEFITLLSTARVPASDHLPGNCAQQHTRSRVDTLRAQGFARQAVMGSLIGARLWTIKAQGI